MADRAARPAQQSIAIVGMSGRFPGAPSLEQFWENLRDGRESIVTFGEQELDAAGIPPHVYRQPNYVKSRGLLQDVDRFDARFFGYSPLEADVLDPQQRLFLECAWEALERAGYNPKGCSAPVGVFAGGTTSSYTSYLGSAEERARLLGPFQVAFSNDQDYLATRVAYKLNLRGPSLSVQTACSTSLVAVALACQSLRDYQCDMALAGGVSIQLPQEAGSLYEEGGVVSPDGHCRAFDAAAQGTVAGSGVGVVVLKRLEDAVAAGDAIQAVLWGWAVNNDGAAKVGYTAPSVDGQADVIAMAQALAGVEPDTISFVEAHGTGTPLGDPIEVAALTRVFRAATARTNFCALGSVKTNIGHLDAAAGIAGLIKAVLALQHRQLPPTLHFRQPNPRLDLERSPFYVNATLQEWPAGETLRRAGVSSFGIGGTNAHVVLEEAPAAESIGAASPAQLLAISARTPTALDRATDNLAEHFERHADLDLADVAYTLQVGRASFEHRRVLACRDGADAAAALRARDPRRVFTAAHDEADRPVAFLFPGQGAQYPGMTQGLYRDEPVFRDEVDRCSSLLTPHLGLDLRRVLYPEANQLKQAEQALEQTALAQPALFTVEYALARLWMAWGIRPRAMLGHSVGEYVAACLSGVFSLEDGIELVTVRGRLMQEQSRGAMVAVPLSEQALLPLLGQDLALAAINGPSLCVVSGTVDSVERLTNRLTRQGVEPIRLHTSHAFHSAMMEPMLEPFARTLARIPLRPPRLPYLSNVTGTWADATVTEPAYWTAHARQTVLFGEGLGELLASPDRVLLEVGPGNTLSKLAERHSGYRPEQAVVASVRHPRDRQEDLPVLLTALGRLWLAGLPVDWDRLHAPGQRRRVRLPTYPFERERHWAPMRQEQPAPAASPPSTKRPDVAEWFSMPSWRQAMPPRRPTAAALAGHPSRWMIFADGLGLGDCLAERLERAGHRVAVVTDGGRFRGSGGGRYTIDAGRGADYAALLRVSRADGLVPDRIVHLWSVTGAAGRADTARGLDGALQASFHSLLLLAQALGAAQMDGPVHLTVVSDGMHAISGTERLAPEKATALGPCQVIPLEYPTVHCRAVDVEVPGTGPARERLVDQLLAEFLSPSATAIVAYRGAQRWERAFEPIRPDPDDRHELPLRDGGVYLFTGGTGGISLALAERLATLRRVRLVLVGRSALPERADWPRLRAEHGADPLGRKIGKLLALEALGAEVMVASADVTDHRQVQELIGRVRERFGAINGVVHAAGVAGGGVIQRKTIATAEGVLAPKVRGLLALDAALGDAELDFFVLCSSINAFLGGAGQVDYCAANAFLDAYAHCSTLTRGRRMLSINWDTWREVGMAVRGDLPPDLEALRAESLEEGILPDEGADAFIRLLGTPLPQVVVSTRDLRRLVDGNADIQTRGAVPAAAPPAAPSRHARPGLATDYEAPSNEVEQAIADVWQELLGIERVGRHDNFFELGGHSLLAIQLRARLRASLQADVAIQALFETPTVAELARLVARSRAPEDESDKVLRMLELVEGLPEEAVRELLADAPGHGD